MEQEKNLDLNKENPCCSGKCAGSCKKDHIYTKTWKDWLFFIIIILCIFALIIWITNKDEVNSNNVQKEKVQVSPPILFRGNSNL